MKSLNNPKLNIKDFLLWTAILIATILAFFGTYYFHFSGPIKALVWIGWVVIVALIGFYTSQGKKVFAFAKEAKIELQKVVWPSRQETIQTTSIVVVMVGVTGFILWGIDSGMMWIIGKLTRLG